MVARRIARMLGKREEEIGGNKSRKKRNNHWRGRGKRNWVDLPGDVMLLILTKVGEDNTMDMMRNALNVCSSWRQHAKDPCLYRRVNICEIGKGRRWRFPKGQIRSGLPNCAKEIIDRSCGNMEKFTCYFTICSKEDLLTYMFSQLKSLTSLVLQFHDTQIVHLVAQIVKSYPLLEELELSCGWFLIQVIQQVAQFEKLKYFHLDYTSPYGDNQGVGGDRTAAAIAEYLPHLRRLQITRSPLTFRGLEAILNGCPHLEYLQLQGCIHLLDPQGNSLNKLIVVAGSSGIADMKVQFTSLPKPTITLSSKSQTEEEQGAAAQP